uniref:ZP domain-containing protein n=1 Tax=Octopus bimaculoides TaxID=37653 RepID=A0A0L8I0I6_OCTBM
MALQLTFFHFTLLLTVSVITHVSTGGIGKIHIGESRNSTTSSTKFYSWPYYQKTGLLPIYLSVQNHSIDSDVLDLTENVTVYCQQDPSTNGFSLVQFSPLYLIPPITEGYVSVEFLRPGRPVNVQCFGTSDPIGASRNLSLNPQFLNDTSLSKPRLLVIKKSPVVNICNSSIIIPLRNQSRNITGVISAMFSESTISSVTVVCQQEVVSEQVVCQQEQNVSDWNTMQIMLENLTVPNNSKSFEISYTVKELGSPVQVYCEANSSEGNQYLLSTSRGYPTRFQQNQVFLNFHPSTLKVKTLSFQHGLCSLEKPGDEK